MMKVFFDENMSPHIARAMNHLCFWEDIEVLITKEISEIGTFGKPQTDEEIAKYVAEQRGFIITRDGDFKQQRLIAGLVKKHGYEIGVFLVPDLVHWDQVKLIANRWGDMMTAMRTIDKPFWCKVTPRGGVKQLPNP